MSFVTKYAIRIADLFRCSWWLYRSQSRTSDLHVVAILVIVDDLQVLFYTFCLPRHLSDQFRYEILAPVVFWLSHLCQNKKKVSIAIFFLFYSFLPLTPFNTTLIFKRLCPPPFPADVDWWLTGHIISHARLQLTSHWTAYTFEKNKQGHTQVFGLSEARCSCNTSTIKESAIGSHCENV